MELALKTNVRALEQNEAQLRDAVKDFEVSDDRLTLRVRELEALNDVISARAHQLQEEKSQLVYEMSDAQTSQAQREGDTQRLDLQVGVEVQGTSWAPVALTLVVVL